MTNSKDKYVKTVKVSIIGKTTGEQFTGDFKIKTLLSYAEQLAEDRMRREYLSGPAEVPPGGNAVQIANLFAAIGVRAIETPTWWKESNNGLDLFDSNVVADVYEEMAKAVAAQTKELQDAAAEAKKKLVEAAKADTADQ